VLVDGPFRRLLPRLRVPFCAHRQTEKPSKRVVRNGWRIEGGANHTGKTAPVKKLLLAVTKTIRVRRFETFCARAGL